MLKFVAFAVAATAGQKAERDNENSEQAEDDEVPNSYERPRHEYQAKSDRYKQ